MRADRRERFGGANRIGNDRNGQTVRELRKTFYVAGWIIAAAADQSHQPAIAFDTKENPATLSLRRRRLHKRARPTAVKVRGNAIHPTRITEMRVNHRLLRRFVSEILQPVRRT